MLVVEARYHEACENHEGFCTKCDDFTRDSTEPDAEAYDCPECGENTVMGTEQALIMGLLHIS